MTEHSHNTLSEFQTYLRERNLAPEKHIPLLAAVLLAGYRRLLRSPQQKSFASPENLFSTIP
jgi:hypothetical protein